MEISPPPPPSTTITTAATTVKTPDPESEPPKQPIPPPFTNGVLKRHKPFNHHQPLSPPVVVTYKECLKNHAASMGGHAVDGCGEFMPSPSSSPSLPTSLKCAACGCHRNFHRREQDHFQQQPPSPPPPPMQHLLEYQPHHRHQPPPPQQPLTTTSPLNSPSSPPPISSSYYPSSAPHMLLALGSETNHYSTTPMSGKKRFRTKFTQAQKDKMHEIASKVGWKMQKRDEEMINGFCNEIGVDRNVFKVWMHNNKSTNKNINNENNLGHSNNIINVNNINGHDAIDFIMSRNINNNNVSHNDDVINGNNNNNNNNNHHNLHLVSGNVIKGSSSSC